MSSATTLHSFVEHAAKNWRDTHPAVYVPTNSAPDSFGDKIRTAVPYNSRDNKVVWTDACAIPWIVVKSMPRTRYARYAGFFLRATYAWLKITRPDLHLAMANGSASATIIPIVGVRLGMITDVGEPPECARSAIGSYLCYDGKRNNLWIRGSDGSASMALWLNALRDIPDVPGPTREALLAWCGLAPLVACMAASTAYALGSCYTVPFVQKSISSYLLSHMHGEAYALMKLHLPLTWDSAFDGALAGFPEAAARAWATDPIMPLCAERRAQSDPVAIEHSRAREKDTLAKFQRSIRGSTAAAEAASVDGMWAQIRAARIDTLSTDPQDDTVSMATALLENAEDGLLGPGDSVSALQTAVPSRAPTPPMEMTARQADTIREVARQAQQEPQTAASLLMGARGDQSVEF